MAANREITFTLLDTNPKALKSGSRVGFAFPSPFPLKYQDVEIVSLNRRVNKENEEWMCI